MKFVAVKYILEQHIGECTYMGNDKIHSNSHGEKVRKADFKCRCGNVFHARIVDVKNGNTNSCGCLVKKLCKKNFSTHGLSKTTEYKSWLCIKERCYNETNHKYQKYGNIGIKMCDRWKYSFENFYADMGPKPRKGDTVDRYPDKHGNYEPGNCRWATQKQQQGNRDSNVWLEAYGKRMILADWADLFGVDSSVVSYHLRKKTMEQVFDFYNKKKKICC